MKCASTKHGVQCATLDLMKKMPAQFVWLLVVTLEMVRGWL
ncbi:hypothetical protein SPBRAN_833 [uncultured Candidatus Thioglobus sp.]|nr:hypothetical protein SPBRAN_833 [uncultured Candidatus Thioglobus sp.]